MLGSGRTHVDQSQAAILDPTVHDGCYDGTGKSLAPGAASLHGHEPKDQHAVRCGVGRDGTLPLATLETGSEDPNRNQP